MGLIVASNMCAILRVVGCLILLSNRCFMGISQQVQSKPWQNCLNRQNSKCGLFFEHPEELKKISGVHVVNNNVCKPVLPCFVLGSSDNLLQNRSQMAKVKKIVENVQLHIVPQIVVGDQKVENIQLAEIDLLAMQNCVSENDVK
jgi:hypothetical protein